MKNVAVFGATGLVGEHMIKVLEERDFPIKNLYLYSSERSEGKKIRFKDEELVVVSEYEDFLDELDIALFALKQPGERSYPG